ncbi:Arm DNA-binding domain-containing protein [Synechococcus sp. PCC 6312]|uniref:Arm DNA-binding domain-containing protein n=1 Tax=Synechococcus sp. (strain ATCC 27167 / PCC 6312) TaxID=195253 RepID=UPI00029F014F|nr:Arm DNA-binding domain-containing protein [Synechococcus sp. PCC 6312]AFY61738.1 hypothetical protein Syn6312_2644 [Synechococcus sp. PCC 6312]
MLTGLAIRKAKTTEKTQKLFDGAELYLEVPKKGNKRWRLKYRYQGKVKLISLGIYPTITLADARQRRDKAKKPLANGI